MISCIPQLVDVISRNKEIAIYGAGKVGKAVVSFWNNNYSIEKIKAILVSEQGGQENSLCSIPVVQIDDATLDKKIPIIITTKSILHDPIMNRIREYGFKNIDIISDDLCDDLIKRYNRSHADYSAELKQLQDGIIRTMPQPKLHYVVLNILEHCNLNCKGCDHFAPLAKERCIPYKTIERDLRRFSELMEQEVDIIGIMGGEPLLHPELLDIVKAARKYFPNTRIQIDTNGILLKSLENDFWETVKNNNAVITNTKYPINLDYEKIKDFCYEKGVSYEFYGNTGQVEKTLYKVCMDVDGNQEPRKSFFSCSHANNCVTLMDGRLYTCTIAPNSHIFNEYYKTNMELCKEDYIAIHECDISKKEILEFLSNPIPFCRYCDIEHRSFGHKWDISQKEMDEWVLTEREKYPNEEKRIKTRTKELKFEVHLVEHCNLKCRGCFHFSPLAEKEFLDVAEYERDCKRLSELYGGRAKQILLLGGEPLLHPRINDFIIITRKQFPVAEISIVTNGIPLLQLNEEFWICCRENDIVIKPTKYPISLNYKKIHEIAHGYDVKIQYFNNGDVEKTLSFQPLDLQGGQPKEGNFYGCYRANSCITLKHGKLYTCLMPAHIHHFAKYFGEKMPDFDSDGIDIYRAESADEISDFLTKPINMCSYCDRAHVKDGLKWQRSNCAKEEWVSV